ncbi:MAG: hypothetical protein ACK47L_07810, partial [Pseudanabaena sp.]
CNATLSKSLLGFSQPKALNLNLIIPVYLSNIAIRKSLYNFLLSDRGTEFGDANPSFTRVVNTMK